MKKVPLKDVFEEVKDFLGSNITGLETGCSFLWEPKNMDNLSTYNIAKYLLESPSTLFSLDNDLKHINTCVYWLKEHGLLDSNIDISYCPDSVSMMESIYDDGYFTFNFFWLDTSEDEEHGLQEYELARKLSRGKHVVCIDDYGCENSVKWKASSEKLKQEATFYKVYDTATGLIVGYFESEETVNETQSN